MGSRVKTYDATGIAPNGKLYAGDLNSIQDDYADLSNFAQTHGIGTLQIGETGLQLLKYGVGEARLTGLLRTDGLIRGLGGLFAGTFTNAQMVAIPSGSRPYGLMVFNTTYNQFFMNVGSDATPVWVPTSYDPGDGLVNGQIARVHVEHDPVNIANSTDVDINWLDGDFETVAGMHDDVTNPNRIIAVKAGYYKIRAGTLWEGNNTGQRGMTINKYSSSAVFQSAIGKTSFAPNNASGLAQEVHANAQFLAGEFIKVSVRQSSGSTLAINPVFDNSGYISATMERIGA